MTKHSRQVPNEAQGFYRELVELQRETNSLLAKQNRRMEEFMALNASSDSVSDNDDGDYLEDADEDSDSRSNYKTDESGKESDDPDDRILLKIPWKIRFYPPPGTNMKRLVAWQIERHLQMEGDRDQNIDIYYHGKKYFYSSFQMRTARELERGKPYKNGNLGIKSQRSHHYNGDAFHMGPFGPTPWGVPAAALLAAITSQCDYPQDWMLLDRPRELLIAMERWYKYKDPREISKDARDWQDLQKLEKTKWDQAFEVCGSGENNMCSRCLDRATKVKVKLEPMSL
ncbi:hypothetical protein N7454_003202 [Penicillium verhagenii]|nr:hypothetical protein N7454_003202 [Penicillium verhagenii]